MKYREAQKVKVGDIVYVVNLETFKVQPRRVLRNGDLRECVKLRGYYLTGGRGWRLVEITCRGIFRTKKQALRYALTVVRKEEAFYRRELTKVLSSKKALQKELTKK